MCLTREAAATLLVLQLLDAGVVAATLLLLLLLLLLPWPHLSRVIGSLCAMFFMVGYLGLFVSGCWLKGSNLSASISRRPAVPETRSAIQV